MVSGVEGNNRQGEVDKRNRAEASRRETETAKKHAAEIETLQRQNYEKMKALEETYQKQLDQQRDATKSALSDRDMKYQQEMEEIRQMNREKIMGLTGNYEDRLKQTRENSKNTIESEKRVNETQKKALSENLLSEVKRRDKMYAESLERAKQQQTQGMAHEKDNLQERHERDLRILSDERNETVGRIKDDLRNVSRQKQAQDKDHKIGMMDQKKKLGDLFDDQLQIERRTNSDQQKFQREAFNNSLDNVQKKYGEALYEEKLRNDGNHENLRADVAARQEGQVAMLERKIRNTNDRSTRAQSETKRLADVEKRDLMEGLRNNLSASEKTRIEAIKDSNRQNAENIRDIVQKNSELTHRQFVTTQEKVNMLQLQHADEVEQKTNLLTQENERLKMGNDANDKLRAETYERDRKNLEEFYNKNLVAMKKNYDESLVEQRMAAIKERNLVMEKLASQMRANESKAADKLAIANSKQIKEVEDMKAQHSKDVEIMRRNYETRLANDNKLAGQNLESLKLKYETQIANQKEAYEEKMRQMQKGIDQEKIAMAKAKT